MVVPTNSEKNNSILESIMTKSKSEIFLAALIAAQQEIDPIRKDAVNPHFKSKYAKIEEMLLAVKPVLNQYSLYLFFITETKEGIDYIKAKIIHENGEFIECAMPIKIKNEVDKNDPQKYGAAVTYAKRYSLSALMALGEEDDDGNKAAGRREEIQTPMPIIPQKKYSELKEMMENSTSFEELEKAAEELKLFQTGFYFTKDQLDVMRKCYALMKKELTENKD